MDEEALNANVLKFLKKLGVTAQREIEKVVRDADAQGHLKSGERLLASRRHSGRYRPQIRDRRRYRAGVRLGPLADPELGRRYVALRRQRSHVRIVSGAPDFNA
jgi:hypothetical protein